MNASLEERVLKHVYREGYQPVKPKVIAKKLGLTTTQEKRELKKAIRRLVKQGKLAYGASHLVRRGGEEQKKQEVIGVFRRTRKGDGLVIPKAIPGRGKLPAIFVPRRRTLDASTGDVVRVRVLRESVEGDRLRGSVVEIVQRETHRFVGTYAERDGWGVVSVDGGVFAQPVPVGDPGAKNVAP